MNYNLLGDILKNARTAVRMTQGEVANKLNTSFQTISNWERGVSKIDIESLDILCDLYGISTADTIRRVVDTQTPPTDPRQQRLNDNYNKLNETGKDRLVEHSDDMVSSGNYKAEPLRVIKSKKVADVIDDETYTIKIAARGGGIIEKVMTKEEYEDFIERENKLMEIESKIDPRL